MNKFKSLGVAALLGGTALASQPAHAVLQIAATINGSNFLCVDETACDTSSGQVGVLTTGLVTIGGVQFTGSEQDQINGPPIDALTTTSLSIKNNTGSTATIAFAVGGTSFTSPVATYSASGSGTWLNANGSTIQMSWAGDTGNTQGADSATDLPGTLLTQSGLFTANVPNPGTDSYSFNHTGAFVANAPFSWTMGATGTLTSGGTVQLIGRSQDITSAVVGVAEPGSLALLASSLMGAGVVLYRRRRKDDNGINGAAV